MNALTSNAKYDTVTNWKEEARKLDLPVFPIAIAWDEQQEKWTKTPLTRNGHKDATTDVDALNWAGANGYGIPMGDGLYALDVDDYKEANKISNWMAQNKVDLRTRAHVTVSGGAHLLYKLPPGFEDLKSRQNVVPGLDTRGAGGWIAFGEGYSVKNDRDPTQLSTMVCTELRDGHSSSKKSGGRITPIVDVSRPDEALIARVQIAVNTERRLGDSLLAKIGDRSSRVFSVAYWMKRMGFTPEEFAATIVHLSPYVGGHVRDLPTDTLMHRALGRAWDRNSGVSNIELRRKFKEFQKWMK